MSKHLNGWQARGMPTKRFHPGSPRLSIAADVEMTVWTPEEAARLRLGERRVLGRLLLLRWKQRWYKRHQIQSARLRQMSQEEVPFLVLIEFRRGYRGVVWIAAIKNDTNASFSNEEMQAVLDDLHLASLPQISASSSKPAGDQTPASTPARKA